MSGRPRASASGSRRISSTPGSIRRRFGRWCARSPGSAISSWAARPTPCCLRTRSSRACSRATTSCSRTTRPIRGSSCAANPFRAWSRRGASSATDRAISAPTPRCSSSGASSNSSARSCRCAPADSTSRPRPSPGGNTPSACSTTWATAGARAWGVRARRSTTGRSTSWSRCCAATCAPSGGS